MWHSPFKHVYNTLCIERSINKDSLTRLSLQSLSLHYVRTPYDKLKTDLTCTRFKWRIIFERLRNNCNPMMMSNLCFKFFLKFNVGYFSRTINSTNWVFGYGMIHTYGNIKRTCSVVLPTVYKLKDHIGYARIEYIVVFFTVLLLLIRKYIIVNLRLWRL